MCLINAKVCVLKSWVGIFAVRLVHAEAEKKKKKEKSHMMTVATGDQHLYFAFLVSKWIFY